MNVKTAVEKLAYDIGKDVGLGDDESQANLINGLSHGLAMGCGNNLDKQLCYMADRLSKESSIVLKELVEFIILKEKGE